MNKLLPNTFIVKIKGILKSVHNPEECIEASLLKGKKVEYIGKTNDKGELNND